MYKWPESNAETTEQLRRFKSNDDISTLFVKDDMRLSSCSAEEWESDGGDDMSWLHLETKKPNFSSKALVEDDGSEIQTLYSFEDITTVYNWETSNDEWGGAVETTNNNVENRKKELFVRRRERGGPSPVVSFSLANLSGERVAPAAFFISSSSPRLPQSHSASSIPLVEDLVNYDPLFYSKIYDKISSAENLDEEGCNLRRAKSNFEGSSELDNGKQTNDNRQKKVISWANLKKQKGVPNIVRLLSKEQQDKLQQDRHARELWGKATTLGKVKKEYKSLKGIP